MIWRKTMRELWLIGFAYLAILELLAIPVLLLWPEIYADLDNCTPCIFVLSTGADPTNMLFKFCAERKKLQSARSR